MTAKAVTAGWARSRGLLGAVLLLAVFAVGGTAGVFQLAAKSGGVSTPSITSGPPAATTSSSATFTFTASPTPPQFQCQLDSAAYAVCTSPKTYTSVAPGTHTFRVKAVSGTQQSSPASRSWTVDVTAPPAPAFTSKPAAVSSTSSPSFSFTDSESGVTFLCKLDAGSYTACTSPKQLSNLAEGSHTFTVVARDAAGNQSGTTFWTWTVDTKAPPAPTITAKPPATSSSATNTFAWSDAESGVTFQCSIESGAWFSCSSPYTYTVTKSNNQEHQFAVRARDAAGNASTPTSYKFKVIASAGGVPFQISGAVTQMVLGAWKPIPVTVTNPNNVPIFVTGLVVSVAADSTPSGCTSSTNVQVQQSNVSSTLMLQVPANGSVVLPAQGVFAPQIRLADLPTVNQDVCKNKTFALSYSGSAHS